MRNSAGRLGPHIDVRADGGYVIAPVVASASAPTRSATAPR